MHKVFDEESTQVHKDSMKNIEASGCRNYQRRSHQRVCLTRPNGYTLYEKCNKAVEAASDRRVVLSFRTQFDGITRYLFKI
jgi:hypothetical protein